MQQTRSIEKSIYYIFEAGVIGKGIFAVLDILSATLLWIFGPHAFARIIIMLTQGELLEDPHNVFALWVTKMMSLPHPQVTAFAILYLFIHGTINAIFVIGLLREKLWAYRLAIIAMSAFFIYQTYRLLAAPSAWMIILTTFDLGVLILVFHEYNLRKHPDPRSK